MFPGYGALKVQLFCQMAGGEDGPGNTEGQYAG